jgi:hypothetical protein
MKGKLDDGTPVDVEKPGAIEWDGKWWEFTEYRRPQKNEFCSNDDKTALWRSEGVSRYPNWIASEIPRATPEQLAAIGMKEREGRPVECKAGDCVWTSSEVHPVAGMFSAQGSVVGKYRFVLEPVEKKGVHTSCEGCVEEMRFVHSQCFDCGFERKNYTPAQPPMDGYRLLEYGEVVQEGDEFVTDRYWIKTSNPGHVFGAKEDREMQMNYRRKIAQPPFLTKDGKPLPCEDCRIYRTAGCTATDRSKSFFNLSCFGCFQPKCPTQPEEPRFSVDEIINIVWPILRDYEGTCHQDICRIIEKAFTERRMG